MDNRNYILDLLSRGAAPADVARIVGCSPSYISQLSGDSAFAQELAEKRAGHINERNSRAQKVQAIHDKYLAIEETLLENLGKQAKANLLKPIEQMKLLQVVAGKKEPPAAIQEGLGSSGAPGVQITNITLPMAVAQKFVLNENREIIGTESGMSFAPMSGSALKTFAAAQGPSSPATPQLTSTKDILALFEGGNPEDLGLEF